MILTPRVLFIGLDGSGRARIVIQSDRFAAEHPAAWVEMQQYLVQPWDGAPVFNDGDTAHAQFASLTQLRTLSAAHGLWAPDPLE